MLVLQAMHGLSLQQTEYLVRDRLSWMRFCGLGPGDAVPDANTLWDFREALIAARALDRLFERLDRAISDAGYLPMSGQIVDATLVAAPKQRNTEAEKAAIKAGRSRRLEGQAGQARQKDRDARWTVKFSKAKPGRRHPQVDIAIPVFGYKNHISIDRKHGVIRRHKVTDAAAPDGARLREGLIDRNNTASDVWADTAYRSQANEEYLDRHGKMSRIHRRKPKGKPMPKAMPAPMRRSRRCAPMSSMSSPSRRTAWACSSAPSAWPARGRDHDRQHGLQHETVVLAGAPTSSGMKERRAGRGKKSQ